MQLFEYFISRFDLLQSLSAAIVLFAIIDVLGSTPIFLDLQQHGKPIHPLKATILSCVIMLSFFYGGHVILQLFHVDIHSFAIAGSLVLFLMGMEMILDVVIFKNTGPVKEATLVPVVFPLLAGPAAFTTLISLKAEYAQVNILFGLFVNMLFVYIVLKCTHIILRYISPSAIYIMRKFLGIILLAISVRMFTVNIADAWATIMG